MIACPPSIWDRRSAWMRTRTAELRDLLEWDEWLLWCVAADEWEADNV